MNNPPTIIITGSSGLVGSGLVSYFSRKGFRVRAFQRNIPKQRNSGVEYYSFDLAEVQDRGFSRADYLIHCAYRPVISKKDRESGVNIDIEGTKKIIALSRKYGIKVIFLSTSSAHPGSESYYARNKLVAERLFDKNIDLVLKLGLVLGKGGGLLGRIADSLKNHKIIPLIGGGRQRVQTIALDDLCSIIDVGITKNITGNFIIAHPGAITMEHLYRKLADNLGVRPVFIPAPLGLTYGLVRTAETLGLKLPFTSQNILGLKDLKTFNNADDLKTFGVEVKNYEATLNILKLHE